MTDTDRGLAATLAADTAARAARVTRDAEATIALASAYDAAAPEGLPTPYMVHPFTLYGTVGSVHWEDITPDGALSIMDAFPTLPATDYRDRHGRSVRPVCGLPEPWPEDAQAGTISGRFLALDRTAGYPTRVALEWFTDMAGYVVRCSVKLRPIHGVTPEIRAIVERYPGGGPIKSVHGCHVHSELPMPDTYTIRYAAGARDQYNSFIVAARFEAGRPCPIREFVATMAAECDARGQDSRAAYERDRADPSRLDIEPAKSYRGVMQPGTRAQHAALQTLEARQTWALARKHWDQYTAERGIERASHRYGADYYLFALDWLTRQGLQPDPNGPDGRPYAYGSAWLKGDTE